MAGRNGSSVSRGYTARCFAGGEGWTGCLMNYLVAIPRAAPLLLSLNSGAIDGCTGGIGGDTLIQTLSGLA